MQLFSYEGKATVDVHLSHNFLCSNAHFEESNWHPNIRAGSAF